MIPRRVTIVEVGPRDGLQNEKAGISTADKVAFVNLLSRAGLPVVEVTAFVSPKWVPQMADAADVMARIDRTPGTRYTALVPNLAGLERAHAAGVSEVAIFAAASETFSRRNINQSIDESLNAYSAVAARAQALGMRVRAYLSTAFGCPFEGAVDPARVASLSAALIEMGAFEVAVSDTIGIAHPGQVPVVLEAVAARVPLAQIALHLHDTRGTALANVLVALQHGVATFDASCGGLGGCPYAPGATGNLASEDLVYMLDGLGIETGVRLDRLVEASRFIEPLVAHALPSRYYRAAQSTPPSA
jgi:hydroxymethylglutaryl-CoA lyase